MASTKSKKAKKADKPKTSKETPEVAAPQVATEVGVSAPTIPRMVLDQILTLQLLVAWAGEGKTDPPRLGWWRTSLVDEFGGEALFKDLTPRTWRWVVLEAARIAARSVDSAARSHAADGDQLISLFHFGFAIDEQLDDRLSELKRSTPEPAEALAELSVTSTGWNSEKFVTWLSALAPVTSTASTVGRRLKASLPSDQGAAAQMLAAAMTPITERYPAPHFKVER